MDIVKFRVPNPIPFLEDIDNGSYLSQPIFPYLEKEQSGLFRLLKRRSLPVRRFLDFTIINGDSTQVPISNHYKRSCQCLVTSPPYFNIVDYGNPDQIGIEKTSEGFLHALLKVFLHTSSIMRKGSLTFINLMDTRSSENQKGLSLIGAPYLLALLLVQNDYLWRQTLTLRKRTSRSGRSDHLFKICTETVIMMQNSTDALFNFAEILKPSDSKVKSFKVGLKRDKTQGSFQNTYFDAETHNALSIQGECIDVTPDFKSEHPAPYPIGFVDILIRVGSNPNDYVFDPFSGRGATGLEALSLGRSYLGIELNPEYVNLSIKLLKQKYQDAEELT